MKAGARVQRFDVVIIVDLLLRHQLNSVQIIRFDRIRTNQRS